jgi:hypothetical protein
MASNVQILPRPPVIVNAAADINYAFSVMDIANLAATSVGVAVTVAGLLTVLIVLLE